MTNKVSDQIRTNFEENWLDSATYEGTYKCNISDALNSRVEQDNFAITGNGEIEKEIKTLIPRKIFDEKTNSSQILCKWEGAVARISGDTFIGRLKDLMDEKDSEHEAEFTIDDLQEGDKELLEVGSIFYWYIGYMDTVGGTRTRISLLRFQRLPGWQKNKIKEIEIKAQQLREKLKWT